MDNFLLPVQLQISLAEQEALITLRDALREERLPKDFKFDMSYGACGGNGCGTVGCIGGAVRLMCLTGSQHDIEGLHEPYRHDVRAAFDYVERSELHPTLAPLYYPHPEGMKRRPPFNIYTQADAARAITNYLTTGKPDWLNAASETLKPYLQ